MPAKILDVALLNLEPNEKSMTSWAQFRPDVAEHWHIRFSLSGRSIMMLYFIHPANPTRIDQAVLPTQRERRHPPIRRGEVSGLLAQMMNGEPVTEHSLALSREAGVGE